MTLKTHALIHDKKHVGIEIKFYNLDTFKKQVDASCIDLDSEFVDLNYKAASLIFCHFWRSITITIEANKKHIKNLSNKELTNGQINLLAKGLKSIPTPVTNQTQIRQQLLCDFDQFATCSQATTSHEPIS